MELTYILIAAAIVILPIVLTKLLSGKSGDDAKVLGAYTPGKKPAPGTAPSPDPAHAAPADTAMLADQIKALLAQGNKIEAIKLAREKTGFPLEAAKDLVETIEKGGGHVHVKFSFKTTLKDANELNDQVKQLVAQGKQIEAIKLIRDRTGLDLKRAKDLVDRLG